jgi:hypothetical protein
MAAAPGFLNLNHDHRDRPSLFAQTIVGLSDPTATEHWSTSQRGERVSSSSIRVVAELIYDTSTVTGSPGVRAAMPRARRLLFTADSTELILQIAPSRRAWHVRLTGQILEAGVPVEGVTLDLLHPSPIPETVTDEDGEFRTADLPLGCYGLDFHLSTRVVSIPSIDLY